MDYELLLNEKMSSYTTFKAGGVAEKLYKINNIKGLTEVLDICNAEGLKPLLIGNGSNLLVSDKGIDTPILILGQDFDFVEVNGTEIKAGAATRLSKFAKVAQENGLTGAEFSSGIPGTVGGAIYMNAGAYDGEMKKIVKSVEIFKDGKLQELSCEEMNFSYRHSLAMEEDMIVLSMTAKLLQGDKNQIIAKMNDLNTRRRDKQPLEYPSAGSTFKRPEGMFAGKLIQDSGLAGATVGGAMVSTKHCGFLINYDNATASDIYNLIVKVQDTVEKKYGVRLEPEVKLIGDFS